MKVNNRNRQNNLRNSPTKNMSGFTLVEILVALAIFAVLGVITIVGLHSVIRTHRMLSASDKRISQVMTAMTVMRRDICQMFDLTVSSSTGSGGMPAFQSSNDTAFEFTRAGYTNPLMGASRSTLQRVGYQLKGHQLVRVSWPVLDRAPNTNLSERVILNNVQQFKISFVDDKGQVVESWSNHTNQQSLPRAISISLTLKGIGAIRGIFNINGRGMHVTQ